MFLANYGRIYGKKTLPKKNVVALWRIQSFSSNDHRHHDHQRTMNNQHTQNKLRSNFSAKQALRS